MLQLALNEILHAGEKGLIEILDGHSRAVGQLTQDDHEILGPAVRRAGAHVGPGQFLVFLARLHRAVFQRPRAAQHP